ncbi:unnamed protein product, partial [Eruca vesicaria subsp. sativa]|nr:unnamed protein product [Eruca vesicaria subsp. sativa]
MQLILHKVPKKNTSCVVMYMINYQSLVVNLQHVNFWLDFFLQEGSGKARNSVRFHMLILVFTAIIWHLALTSESSSLFSNGITSMRLPIVLILAVVMIHIVD